MSKPQIGFCGLGAMGFGMATHLVKTGYAVTGYDVLLSAMERFVAAGGLPSASLADSATRKQFYVAMVASAQQAQPALFAENGIVKALPTGATLLLCSTVPSSYARSVEMGLKDVGRDDIFLIDAPLSGGAVRSATGELSVMVGASAAAIKQAGWLLEKISAPSRLFIVDGGIGAGSNMKMVHQVLAGIHILAVSEAYGFGARLGLGRQDVYEAVVKSEAWSWMFENRSKRVLQEDYSPGGSAVSIILKDMAIITSTARDIQFPAALCSIAEQVYFSIQDRGWAGDDDSGIVRIWTSGAVASLQSVSTAEDDGAKLEMVVDLLVGIHLVAAAEAISLAEQVGIPLAQLYKLTCDAAGSSAVFRDLGGKLIQIMAGHAEDRGDVVKEITQRLQRVIDEAQAIRCPLYLGSGALNLLHQAGHSPDLASLLNQYLVL